MLAIKQMMCMTFKERSWECAIVKNLISHTIFKKPPRHWEAFFIPNNQLKKIL